MKNLLGDGRRVTIPSFPEIVVDPDFDRLANRLPEAPRLLIVIVNYRTAELTVDCLESLEPEIEANPGTAVAVVDGGSGDDSAARIQEAVERRGWSSWVGVMPFERNGGFSFGNNRAIAPAMALNSPPEYCLLLNSDTIVRPGALGILLEFMDKNPKVGIAGTRLEDPDGTPQRSAFRFPGVLSELERGTRIGLVSKLLSRWVVAPPPPAHACRTDYVAGAAMIVRREVFESIGLMDEGYFLYYEETDLCRRAAVAGWPCWYVPEARVVHLVGQSTGVTSTRRRRPAYWFESRNRYFLRHLGRVRKTMADVAWTCGFAQWWVRRRLLRKPDPDPPYFLSDFVRHNFLPKRFRR